MSGMDVIRSSVTVVREGWLDYNKNINVLDPLIISRVMLMEKYLQINYES